MTGLSATMTGLRDSAAVRCLNVELGGCVELIG
jgi:hypothetical protein